MNFRKLSFLFIRKVPQRKWRAHGSGAPPSGRSEWDPARAASPLPLAFRGALCNSHWDLRNSHWDLAKLPLGLRVGASAPPSGSFARSHWEGEAGRKMARVARPTRRRDVPLGARGAVLALWRHPDSCDLGDLACCSLGRRARRPRTPPTQSDGRCHSPRQRATPRRPPRTLTHCYRAAPRATWATRPPTRRRSRRARGRRGCRRRTRTSRTTRSTATRRQTSTATTIWCARGPAATPARAARARRTHRQEGKRRRLGTRRVRRTRSQRRYTRLLHHLSGHGREGPPPARRRLCPHGRIRTLPGVNHIYKSRVARLCSGLRP